MELTFKHLYDDKWAHIQKRRNKYDRPTLIFPHGFIPVIGKKYPCIVNIRPLATFTYNDTNYNVSVAYLKREASIIDRIDYKFGLRKVKKTTMGLAFERAADNQVKENK